MSNRKERTLRLRRETLRTLGHRLDDQELAQVAGGGRRTVDCAEETGASLSGSVKCR
jgi:hypothetical protein